MCESSVDIPVFRLATPMEIESVLSRERKEAHSSVGGALPGPSY